MSDIHVLPGDGKGNWTVAFHFAIPDSDNPVGTNYRVALINSGLGGTSQMEEGTGPGQITTAELAQIEAGELYERPVGLPIESGATDNAEMLAFIRSEYARREPDVLAALQKRLKYYGCTVAKE